jgi:hypothetical protein
MSYVQDNLMPNETVLLSARVHPAVFLPSLFPFAASIAFLVWTYKTGTQNTENSGILAGGLFLAFIFFFHCQSGWVFGH